LLNYKPLFHPFLQTWFKVKFGALESNYFSKFRLPPATKWAEHKKVSGKWGSRYLVLASPIFETFLCSAGFVTGGSQVFFCIYQVLASPAQKESAPPIFETGFDLRGSRYLVNAQKESAPPIFETGFNLRGSRYLVNAQKESAPTIFETGFDLWGSRYLVNAQKEPAPTIFDTGFDLCGSPYLVNAQKNPAPTIFETGFDLCGSRYLVNAQKEPIKMNTKIWKKIL